VLVGSKHIEQSRDRVGRIDFVVLRRKMVLREKQKKRGSKPSGELTGKTTNLKGLRVQKNPGGFYPKDKVLRGNHPRVEFKFPRAEFSGAL